MADRIAGWAILFFGVYSLLFHKAYAKYLERSSINPWIGKNSETVTRILIIIGGLFFTIVGFLLLLGLINVGNPQ